METKLYRYVRDTNPFNAEYRILLSVYKVKKETRHGYFIRCARNTKDTFVLKTDKWSKKRFAYITKEDALDNFIRRTKKCIDINQNFVDASKRYLKFAENVVIK